jgi:hypothetical protein
MTSQPQAFSVTTIQDCPEDIDDIIRPLPQYHLDTALFHSWNEHLRRYISLYPQKRVEWAATRKKRLFDDFLCFIFFGSASRSSS